MYFYFALYYHSTSKTTFRVLEPYHKFLLYLWPRLVYGWVSNPLFGETPGLTAKYEYRYVEGFSGQSNITVTQIIGSAEDC